MRTNFSLGVLSLSILAVACGGASAEGPGGATPAKPAAEASAPAAAASGEVNAATLIAREAGSLQVVKAQSTDGNLAVATEATGPATFEVKDNVPRVTIPIGTAQPITCLLRPDSPSTGSLLYSVITGVQKEAPKNEITQLDIGVLGHVPYYVAELQYLDEDSGKPLLGALKVAVFDREGDTFLCMHDEPGYRATFRRIAEAAAKTFAVKDADPQDPPFELEVALAKVQTQPIGYSVERHFVTPEGTHVEVESTTMLIRRSPTELASIESGRVTESGKDGIATKIRVYSEQGGEVDGNIVVERKTGNKYHAEGTMSGKPVKGDFTAKAPLWATWRERNEVRDKLIKSTKTRELTLPGYSATTDPVGVTPSTWRATGEPSVFDITHGGMQVKATLDANGHETKAAFKMGPIEIAIERVVLESKGK
jgi:hypothetical protein